MTTCNSCISSNINFSVVGAEKITGPSTGTEGIVTAAKTGEVVRQELATKHPNPVNVWNASDEERADLLTEYLDAIEEVCPEPRLMPLDEAGKAPAIAGRCDLGSRQSKTMLHTRDEAIEALGQGARGFCLWAGRSEHGTEDLVFADHDDLDAFPLDTLPDTLTVVSGSGEGYHETFVNAGDVRNAKSDGGEIRASNWYVVLPGSVHPSGGIYHVEEERPLAELEADDIPEGLRPSTKSGAKVEIWDIPHEPQHGEFINGLNMSLTEVREYDDDLDRLLDTSPRPDLDPDVQDDNELDAELVRRLRFHHFELSDIAAIWRQYRGRPKLRRDDYVRRTIENCATHDDRCRYDGTEHGVVLPELSSATKWDWQNSDDEPAITLDEARRRCQSRIDDALLNEDRVLIDALPAMGKSSGVIRGAAKTDTLITVFTSRHDLYGQYGEWCDERDLSYHRLPSFHNDCPTAQGEHGDDWKESVLSLYRKGVMASEIHQYGGRYFGEPLPCDDGQECPYKRGWEFDGEECDVLVGHYQHAYNPNVVAGRVAVFDEFPADAFMEKFDGETISQAVSAYLSEHDALPFEDYTGLLEGRDSERGTEAREWFEGRDLERDGEPVLSDKTESAHAYAPLLTYALLLGENLGNGWEYANLDRGGGLTVTHRVSARNRDSGEVFLLLPPELDDAKGVIGLDGTPTQDLWQMVVDRRLHHRQVLSDEERAAYLTDALGLSIIRTTEYVKPYSSGTYVNPEDDGLLFEAVAEREGTEPALISSAKAITQYEQEDVLDPIGKHGYYGNFKGSNEFAHEQAGIVAGSPHYGDDYVERWGALAGNSVERGEGKGVDLDFGEFGNKVLRHMREHEVLQAVLRFGRDGDGANVYVHTAALPEWVPIAAEGEVKRWSKGMKEVVEVLEDEAPGEWRTSEIVETEQVSISPRQVRNVMTQLVDDGYVKRRTEGRGTTWVVEDEEIDWLGRVRFRST